MTRYSFGIFAVVLAFTAVAFKAPEKKLADNLYRFSGNPLVQAQVQAPANWSHIPGGTQNCPTNTNIKACEIKTTTAPVGGKLPSSFSITAALSGSSTYYVTGVTSGMIYNTTP